MLRAFAPNPEPGAGANLLPAVALFRELIRQEILAKKYPLGDIRRYDVLIPFGRFRGIVVNGETY